MDVTCFADLNEGDQAEEAIHHLLVAISYPPFNGEIGLPIRATSQDGGLCVRGSNGRSQEISRPRQIDVSSICSGPAGRQGRAVGAWRSRVEESALRINA